MGYYIYSSINFILLYNIVASDANFMKNVEMQLLAACILLHSINTESFFLLLHIF